ncbi:Phosphoribosylaminoimidazole-succinocarboxamide synthase [Fundidesulfovibrio magnetotacticus]|uniref:Phosphoribosylaminoimidazole-succinocarboxamide synthase n=1 Tax=Fundidesulfovibrio magnetotacticus TaxID=2730080 RepID=A0A6V8LY09_9BACT|nr:phosphoribosylaminoimidazolesuccinocarboxamide synthase [Fundidesulfovibrio magnetotacticus]GFK94537.1 Phosphoribosylaminoimidazole-succinocarboxamide synthase [Fundidesulfovibrio magnetotacticus]
MQVAVTTDIKEYPLISRGKVRDIYQVADDALLIVTTDRISAFDVVLPDPIPFKGVILNKITTFWMRMFDGVVENHLLAVDVADFPAKLKPYADMLEGRAVLARKAKPLPIECIVRGFITGSGWKDYKATGKVCGHELPQGLEESQMLEAPLFTPSTKADIGQHDENITLEQAKALTGQDVFHKAQETALAIYSKARAYASGRGILIADTKFEFGMIGDKLILIDEVLTPDSSRFWPAEGFKPGQGQPSFDKQYLRDWLESVGFNKKPPAPAMPEEVARRTQAKYLEAYQALTGESLTF